MTSEFPQNALLIWKICAAGQDVKQVIAVETTVMKWKMLIGVKIDMQEMSGYFRHLREM